ncbi:organic cation transporter-like protein isoform X2 [Arctopsyche grandis]|uniref:organic cation transporter-like protein isoform X2 n=1 Tax=Arctopsyche grandis TaxID=121162 RepID=UPI00406D8E7E
MPCSKLEPLLISSKTPQAIIKEMDNKIQPTEENIPSTSTNDICSELMGNWGRWQFRTVSIIFLTKIPAAWFMACIIFTAPDPWYGEYKCDLSEYENNTSWISITHPNIITADGSHESDFCSVILEPNLNSNYSEQYWKMISTNTDIHNETMVPCNTFEYSLDIYTTLITQFDLVCSRNILIATTQCFHLFGVLLGGIAANELMVFFSPRLVMMGGMILLLPCGISTGLVPWLWLHVALRCMSAACCALIFTPGGVIFSDIVGGRPKVIVSANFEQFWPIGVILLTAIGYFTNNWSQVYMTITIPILLIMILWIWIPDSPRWHMERGNVEKVKDILENAVKVNKSNKNIPDNLMQILQSEADAIAIRNQNAQSQNNWWHLFSIPGAVWTVILTATSLGLMLTCYYGTLLNIRSFGRGYLYFTTPIAGLCEIAGGIIGFLILLFCKYKWKLIGTITTITGLITCTIWTMPAHVDGSHMFLDLMLLSMLNKIGISACLCVLTTCTPELFPFPHKKRIVYGSTVIARIIFLTAPFIGATVKFGDAVPLSFFGILSAIGGLCAFVLKPVHFKSENLPNLIRPAEMKF